MTDFRIPLGSWVDEFIDFVIDVFGFFFDFVATVIGGAYELVDGVLSGPPSWVVIAVLAAFALAARGWKFALGTVVGLVLVVGIDQWTNAMHTLSLVLVASTVALLIAVPLGIAAAKSRATSAFLRPILDLTQTMPAFVYLIPALILFGVGPVPGVVATVIFAVAPGVRLTELGIRSVDSEVVEAGQAFGASPGRVLRQIQLPLALPTIMAGVNQVIMLSLSMVVIAGMVGADGLGKDVVASLNRIDVALGFEAGLAVVILAIYLDRLTAALGGGETPLGRALGRRRAVREGAAAPAEPAGRELVDA